MKKAWLFLVVCASVSAVTAAPALANPLDVYGVGARARGMGGPMTGIVSGGAAAYYNDAFLSFEDEIELQLGCLLSGPSLKINGSNYENLGTMWGCDAIAGVPFRGKLKWFSLGFVMYVPGSNLVKTYMQQATMPQFLMWRNMDSFAMYPAVSFKVWEYLSLGVGLNIFGSLKGKANVGVDIGSQQFTTREIQLNLGVNVAPTGGIAFKYKDIVSAGFSFRGEQKLPEDLTTTLNMEIVTLSVPLYGTAFFTPWQFSLGVGYKPIKNLQLAVDATYYLWSRAPDQSLMVDINASVLIPNMSSTPLPMGFKDTISPRIGVEWLPIEALSLRLGYNYVPTPVPNQIHVSNIADCDQHVLALGVGYRFKDPNEITNGVALDAFFQYHFMVPRTIIKASPVDPVGDYSISGGVPMGGLSLRIFL